MLIEIHRDDINSLPHLLHALRGWVIRRFVLFCDDLSFDNNDHTYKSLKTVLEGGIEGRPDHILFYATSNRRHLMPRDMIENERSTAIHPGEAVEEKISLSDRFGLWLGFHSCSQETYLSIVSEAYAHGISNWRWIPGRFTPKQALPSGPANTRGAPLRPRGVAVYSGFSGENGERRSKLCHSRAQVSIRLSYMLK